MHLSNEEMYSEFQRLKEENFKLRKQVNRMYGRIRYLEKLLRKLRRQIKKTERQDVQRYKNGKRGTFKNG